MRIAIPVVQGKLSLHFGHALEFAFIDVINGEITNVNYLTPPPHEPGSLPAWRSDFSVDIVICGGLGMRAQQFFEQYGIKVVIGAPSMPAEEIVRRYLAGSLETSENICDH
jgi:predicted Fe-Mo cluster-binding NifX family protein